MSHKPFAIGTASLKRGAFAIPVVLTVLISAPSTYGQIPCGYEVTAIIQAPECPPFGFPPTIGTAISEPIDDGLPNVVGHYQSCVIGPDKAFLWIGNEDRFITLPMPPGTTRSYAVDISGSRIVGRYDNPQLELGTTGFLYNFETDEFTSLGTLPGGNTSEAHGVNVKGEIVGFWGDVVKGPSPLAFLWRDGKMIDINPDLGTDSSEANDINVNGAITGWLREDGGERLAFIWEDGKVTELPPIPGGVTSRGNGINARRQLAIGGKFNDDHPRGFISGGFLWEAGRWIDLGMLPGYDSMAVKGLNDAGDVVGWSRDIQTGEHPDTGFMWRNGDMLNLNDLIGPATGLWIKRADGINEAGQITGRATGPSGIVTFVLTRIEPPLGDLSGDCKVGAADLLILLASWGPCGDCDDCPADLDGNCVVGASDLLILLVNWE